jgi:GAF domain-containing protein
MSGWWSALNPNNWMIRTKLSVAILFIVLAPTLLTLVLINIGAQEHDQVMVENYLMTYGEDHRLSISESLDHARQLLSTFSSDVRYRRVTNTALENPDNRNSHDIFIDLLDNRLIQTGYFTEILLVDAEGNTIANSQRNLGVTTSVDMSSSFGFQAGTDAVLLNEDRRDAMYRDLQGNAVYEMVEVLYNNDRTPAGYLIATLNINEILNTHLGLTDAFIPIVSYLTTNDGLLIAPANAQELAANSRQRPGLVSSLALRQGVYADQSGEELYTHFVNQIEETPLLLVIENYDEIEVNAPVRAFLSTNGPLFIFLLIVFIGVLAWLLYRSIIHPITSFRDAVLALGEGNLDTRVIGVNRRDEIGILARGIVSSREQVLQTLDDLEQRLADRVRDLQATQEVSRYAATQRDLQRLMTDVVNLITNSFPNIYHAQIFLIDVDNRYAVLRASTGEAGEKLLRRGHRLAVGSTSVIGLVTSEGRVIVERDTATSTVHRVNEFLPDTRSELAIPLRVGTKVIGALDVQSKQSNTFFDDQVTLLQIMADQLAISVDNARLYQESLSQLERLNKASQSQTYEGWREQMRSLRQQGIVVQAGNPQINTGILQRHALNTGETTIGDPTAQNTIPVVVPIRLRGQILGVVEWELPSIDYSYEKVLLAEELVDRLAISLDNARLFEESRRTVDRERVVNTITAKFSTQTDIDQILQTAVREVGKVLHVPEVNIRLMGDTDNQSRLPNSPGNIGGDSLSPIWELPDLPYLPETGGSTTGTTNGLTNGYSNGTANSTTNGSTNGHHDDAPKHPDDSDTNNPSQA